jgi:hypothetical protein
MTERTERSRALSQGLAVPSEAIGLVGRSSQAALPCGAEAPPRAHPAKTPTVPRSRTARSWGHLHLLPPANSRGQPRSTIDVSNSSEMIMAGIGWFRCADRLMTAWRARMPVSKKPRKKQSKLPSLKRTSSAALPDRRAMESLKSAFGCDRADSGGGRGRWQGRADHECHGVRCAPR